jgi:hypothetical protein
MQHIYQWAYGPGWERKLFRSRRNRIVCMDVVHNDSHLANKNAAVVIGFREGQHQSEGEVEE